MMVASNEKRGPLAVRTKLWIAAALCGLSAQAMGEISVSRLRCESLENPLGVHESVPRLSWVVESPARGTNQSAWRVIVASSEEKLADGEGDLWDSGKSEGDETCHIPYGGEPLESRSRCYWKVMAWDQDGVASDWSEPSFWTTGLLSPDDWTAEWIDGHQLPAPTANEPPEIVRAIYRSVSGAGGTLDVTAQLAGLAADGEFEIQVDNDAFGSDPAFGHVKVLAVEYRADGVLLQASFPENGWFRYPGDLPPPVEVTLVSATYEAIDGAGSSDVTELIAELTESGAFSLPVDNASLGGDPAENHLKRLRIDYEKDGVSLVKFIGEGRAFNYPADLATPSTVPYLRKAFAVAKPVRRATIHATALGIYELRLNGGRVGDHVLAPEWTDYSQRLNYQEYDVTAMLRAGDNVWAAQLADGWYSGHIGNGGYQRWGTSPALLAQMDIEFEDGTSERIVTDGSWRIGVGPMVATDFMMGEDYDARRELPGWDAPEFDDSAWSPVTVRTETERVISGQVMEPSRELMTLPAKKLTEPAPGKWTYDLGQNLVGVVRLKITAPAGTKITLRHGEMLNPDGTLYTANLRGAPSIDTYVCRGAGEEIWQPKFTFHGFRYVELSGISEEPPLDAVTGVVIGSDTPITGEFVCSDPLVNQLQSNIEWGQRGNYLSVPTDCPQRDERLGWLGDAQVFVRTATYNADVAAFFNKWLVDVTDSQLPDGRFTDVAPYAGPTVGTPAWGDAGVICPWTIYQAYGDKRVLERSYDSMVEWIDWCGSQSTNFIRTGNRGADYGDWLSINADTNKELIGTAYYAYSTRLLAKAAAVLGKTADAAKYEALFESIKQAFIERYVAADGKITSGTQCAYAMALKFDLLPEDLRESAAKWLEADIVAKGDHLSTGFVGVGYLLPVLTDAGRKDVAYRLIHQDTFPSWLFSIKHGATTIWERWDGWTPENGFQSVIMNSFNHYSLGSCGEWLYATVGGIDQAPDGAAYKRIVIRPQPGGNITSASAKLRTIRGEVVSRWKQHDEGFALHTEIPANTTATVHVPAADAGEVKESGKPAAESEGVTFLRMENGAAVFGVVSGRYLFTTGAVEAGKDTVFHDPGTPARVRISALMADGGETGAEFVSVEPTSVNGGSLHVDGEWLVYTPRDGAEAEDWFAYTVRLADGGLEVRTVRVAAIPDDAPGARPVSVLRGDDGAQRLVFEGVPGRFYRIEYSDDLVADEAWQPLASVQADESGLFEASDDPPLPSARFYRAAHP